MSGVEEKITSGAAYSGAILAVTDERRLFKMRKELSIDDFFHDLG